MRLARRITNLFLLGAVVGAGGWQAASRGPEIITYWRDVAQVRRAERALDRGDQSRALQLLARAGRPGEERLGRLLVACRSPRHWPQLVAALRTSAPETRDALARAMVRSPEERLCAAEALAALGDRRGVRVLAGALSHRSSFAHDPADLLDLGKPGCEALGNVARFGSPKAREQALLLLSDPQVPQTKWELLSLLVDANFPDKPLALRALAPYSGPPVDRIVEGFTVHPEPAIRAEALRQHGARKGRAALPALARALEDRSPRVRMAAVEALCTVEGQDANAFLVRALSDDDSRVVRHAVRGLGRRQAEEAAPALAKLYPHGTRELKQDIAMALCWMESPLGPQYRALWEQDAGQQLALSSAWDG